MAETILLVEDDPSIAKGLEMNLKVEGYTVVCARDGEEALRFINSGSPDLVLLDIMLPKVNGLDVIRQVRTSRADLPILVISAKGQEADKVLGLSIGADDYITKPFGLAEVLARVRAALRRKRREGRAAMHVEFGKVVIDVPSRRVTVAGKPREMTAREFDLLYFFATRPDDAVTREEIMRAVWGNDHYGTARTIDNFVARLREKIGDDAEKPRHIETVRGFGYRFNPD
jgi:DNA-binding response OmpR family regulator